jgi:hypothetical protein
MPTNRPPEAKEQSQQHHGNAQQYVPSHVFGAMKSRGVLTPADSKR